MDRNFYNIAPIYHGWKFGYGFFSNYRICLEQLIVHHESGGKEIPYIDWSKTTWVEGFNPFVSNKIIPNGNPFDCWFEQQIPTSSDNIIFCENQPRPDIILHSKHYFDEPEELKRQQTVDKHYLTLKKHIINKIDDVYEKELKGYNVLGVMARGTEYNLHHPMYGVFDVNDYIREIKVVLKNNPEINKLFIVSEDMDYINKLYEAFPSSFFLPDVFRRTDETMEYINNVHCWCNVSTKRENHCQLLGEEVIIQTKLLGKCNYLFGRLSGVFAGAVLWNENIKKVHLI